MKRYASVVTAMFVCFLGLLWWPAWRFPRSFSRN